MNKLNKVIHSAAAVTLFGLVNIWSQPICSCQPPPPPVYKPVLMTYEDFRKPIKLMPAQRIGEKGRMALYKNHLFINEPDVGMHVFDNTDPSNPIAVGFLPVVGSREFAISNDSLYISSHIDLLVFDLSNISNIQLAERLTDVFKNRYDYKQYGITPNDGLFIALATEGYTP